MHITVFIYQMKVFPVVGMIDCQHRWQCVECSGRTGLLPDDEWQHSLSNIAESFTHLRVASHRPPSDNWGSVCGSGAIPRIAGR